MGKFICSFRNISRYPFGEQFCDFGFFIEGVDNKLTELHPRDIGYNGVPFVGQYDINGCNMKEEFLDGRKLKGIFVSIKLVLDKLRYLKKRYILEINKIINVVSSWLLTCQLL